MHNAILVCFFAVISFVAADHVEKANYNVQLKGAFGVNTTNAEVKLDKSKKTVDVVIESDESKRPTFAGGISDYNIKDNYVVIQPHPLKDRCLLYIPPQELEENVSEVLLTQPANDGALPYVKCSYKNYVAADYTQEVQNAGKRCHKENFTGVLFNCGPEEPANVSFCLLSGILATNDAPYLGCIGNLTDSV